MEQQYTFIIKAGQQTTEVAGRNKAVAEAKGISEKTGKPVGLERQDGRMKMEFRRGSLETYRFDTHDRR